MEDSRRSNPRGGWIHRRRGTALIALLIGLAACGDNADRDGAGAASSAEADSETEAGGEPVLIVVRFDFPNGEVLAESRIGGMPFCPGGTVQSEHGGGAGEGLVVDTFDCPDGELAITYSPTQDSRKQSGLWRVLDGTGRFEALQGFGEFTAEFEKQDQDQGLVRFTGTFTP